MENHKLCGNIGGFIPILVILILVGLGTASFVAVKVFTTQNVSNFTEKERPITDITEASALPSTTEPTQSKVTTPKPTSKTTVKTPSPTPSVSQNTSCQYDLSSPTGSLKINVNASAGAFGCCSLSAELQATTGCKVLDGRSTDKQTLLGNTNSPTITYSSVPPGTYTVRVQNNNQWSESKTVTIITSQLTTTSLTVPGVAPTPVATLQRPVCSPLIAIPSSGTAPLLTNLITGNNSSPYIAIQSVYWDFDGNGSWDLTASDLSSQNHTYQSSGTYYPKVYLVATNGQSSDICQTTVVAN